VALLCGFVLVYALLLALSTLAFWFVRVDNLMALYWAFLDAAGSRSTSIRAGFG